MADEPTSSRIPAAVRQRVFDSFAGLELRWRGDLTDEQFLQRLYDLGAMKSQDYRYRTADADIRQHMTYNRDWADDWVLTDPRFKLLQTSDERFLDFLCMTLHPQVRKNPEEVELLLRIYNEELLPCGATIVPRTALLGGKPRILGFTHRPASLANVEKGLKNVARAADVLSHEYLRLQVDRLWTAASGSPSQAIGSAKELTESICREILRRKQVPVEPDADTKWLVRTAATQLKLVPDGAEFAAAHDPTKAMITGLAGLANSLALLRNAYGTGHGKDATFKELEPRHAILAIESATAICDFLVTTWSGQSS
jgi:AbiJ N-terminal domain 3/Abortive infection C-terminus